MIMSVDVQPVSDIPYLIDRYIEDRAELAVDSVVPYLDKAITNHYDFGPS